MTDEDLRQISRRLYRNDIYDLAKQSDEDCRALLAEVERLRQKNAENSAREKGGSPMTKVAGRPMAPQDLGNVRDGYNGGILGSMVPPGVVIDVNRLLAEVERLRTALQNIAELHPERTHEACDIARRTLEEK